MDTNSTHNFTSNPVPQTYAIPFDFSCALSLPPSLTDATLTVGNPEPRSHAFTFPSTPTASNPNGLSVANPRFAFPPPSGLIGSSNDRHAFGIPTAKDEGRDSMRQAALELLISLSEAHPGMVQSCYGWLKL